MTTFLLVLGGLILFNFILLKFSMQSVDSEIKNKIKNKSKGNPSSEKSKDIRKAA